MLTIESNGTVLASKFIDDTETIWSYGKGGNYPTQIGDLIGGRYKVLFKLGNGVEGNVWLCRDTDIDSPTYYAIKVLLAVLTGHSIEEKISDLVKTDKQNEITGLCLAVGSLMVQSPNGLHHALIYPLMGPAPANRWDLRHDQAGEKLLRKMCLQVSTGLALLLSRNICHGDLRLDNVLATIENINGRSEESIIHDLGQPTEHPVVDRETYEKHNQPSTPQTLIQPLDWTSTGLKINYTNNACIIDFSRSFVSDQAPPTVETYQRPYLIYEAPEVILQPESVSPAADVWALACILYEIRTGLAFIDSVYDIDGPLEDICLILGKLPEPFWSKGWKNRPAIFKDSTDADGRVVFSKARQETQDQYYEDDIYAPRSIHEALRDCYKFGRLHGNFTNPLPLKEEEIDLFSDLLGQMLKYDPSERISAQKVIEHPWFNL